MPPNHGPLRNHDEHDFGPDTHHLLVLYPLSNRAPYPLEKWAKNSTTNATTFTPWYIVIIRWKSITDKLNEPMKTRTGHWTEWVYGIEGEFTKWVQDAFRSDALTEFLNFHYLFVYLFLIYVTTVYFAYSVTGT